MYKSCKCQVNILYELDNLSPINHETLSVSNLKFDNKTQSVKICPGILQTNENLSNCGV